MELIDILRLLSVLGFLLCVGLYGGRGTILFLTKKTLFSLLAGYPYGVTLGSAVGSSVTGGTAGCYGYWMHTALDGLSGYLVPGWLTAQ
jgi:hypothetical protein